MCLYLSVGDITYPVSNLLSDMANDSTFDDIEEEVSSWGYSMSVSDYERSLIEDSTVKKTFPRGKGIADSNYISNVKLASEIMEINEGPLGHLPTTKEVLSERNLNEITPLLRTLGISGHDGPISSKNTRTVSVMRNDIRVEGRLPIILNGELFAMIKDEKNVSNEVGDEPYDPRKPLHEQFTTIKEFAVESKIGQIIPSVSLTLSTSSASDHSSSDSSGSSSTTSFSVSDQDPNDEIFEPLLNSKPKLYTPRQLYELKRKNSLPKGKDCCRVRWLLFCSRHRKVLGRSGLVRLTSCHNPFRILKNI